jgi:hypothetical protein
MFMQEFCYTIVHVKFCYEAEPLIAASLATQDTVEYVSPTTEWVAAEVDMDVDVAQEQLQRILKAETFELIQRAHNYVVGQHCVQRTLDKLRRQARRPL